jgi:uncharacterized membrane protein
MNWSRYQTVSAIACAVLITTGAIVPFIAPVEAQTGQPDPSIDDVDVPDEITLGESFEIEVEADNDGGRAGHYSTVSVSSPNLDDSGDDSQLSVTDDYDHAYSTVRDRGERIFDKSGDRTTADYALAEAGSTSETYWDGGESRDFAAQFTPEEAGTFVVYVRATHTDDDSGQVFNDPNYGVVDQQDYAVERYEVEVKEEVRIDAEIDSMDPASGSYTAGEDASTETTVENTGNRRHEFHVGYSVRGPDGEWRDNDGSTHESVWLDPGETETVTVDWEVENAAPTGEYDVWTTVYRDERYGDLEDRLDGERQRDEFAVTTENSPPSLRADEPSSQTTISPGEEVSFEADADDPDGNLRGVDWYVDSDIADQSWIGGSSETVSWTREFDSAGTYRVEAQAHDEDGEYSDSVSWTVEVEEPERIKAEIEDVDWPRGEMTSSDHVETTVEVENTGNTRHEFYVGYSVRGPDDEWRDNDRSTHESVTLSPGEQRQVDVEWEITDEAPAGDYDVWTTVYADRSGQELEDKRDERRQSSVFSVEETNQTGSVTGYVTTSDGDGLEDVSVSVGGITVETNADGYYNAENVPVGERTISTTIEGQEYTKQQSVSAGQQATTDIEVDLQTTDIQIASFDPQTSTFSPGDEITASVELVNEGTEEKTVRATLGHRGPTGTLLDGGDESTTSLTLAPSEQTTTELSWTVGDDPNVGTYDSVLTVSGGDSQIAQSAENDSVKLQSTDDAATLLDYSQESGTYKPDDSIEVEFAVENNEESSTTYYVEYVARGSNGEMYANDAYFVTRPPPAVRKVHRPRFSTQCLTAHPMEPMMVSSVSGRVEARTHHNHQQTRLPCPMRSQSKIRMRLNLNHLVTKSRRGT